MARRYIVLAILASAMAFGQSRPGTGMGPPASNPGPGRDDASPANDLQLKSIDQVLHDDPQISAKLKEMLPTDLTPQQACTGFKTLEQCVITIHAAQNLKLNFSELKAKTTGKHSISIEKGIEQMATQANAKEEVKRAKKQASEDMKGVSLFGRNRQPRLEQTETILSSTATPLNAN